MKKKVYPTPITKQVELKNQIQLVSASKVKSNGLDDELGLGDGNTTEKDAWEAW